MSVRNFATRVSRVSAVVVALMVAACSDSPVEIPDLTVATVYVSPGDRTLTVGDTMVVIAYPRTANGQIIGSVAVDWETNNSTVAQVTPRGFTSVVRAQSPGQVEVSAVAGGKAGKIRVTVIPAVLPVASVAMLGGPDSITVGSLVRFDAVARAADGTILGGRTVTWQATGAGVITFAGPGDGSHVIVTAQNPGTTTLSATVEGKQAQRTITVRQPQQPVNSVEIVGGNSVITLHTGNTRQLNVRIFAADGTELFGRPVTWTSANTGVASIGQDGVVRAHTVGGTDVTASVEGKTARYFVDVRTRIARIQQNPASMALGRGEEFQLSATLLDENNGALQLPVTWTSSNEDVATVDANGHVTAKAAGSAIIKAHAEGQEGWTDVRVVEWAAFPLEQVADSALPATLFTRGNARVIAREGALLTTLVGSNSGNFQLRFDVTVLEGQSATFGQYLYRGSYHYDVQGTIVFETLSGQRLTARRFPDGRIVITGRLEPDLPEITLTYRAQ